MRGHVESVRREAAGSVLATALAPADTVVEVESARDFSDDGQTHAVTVGAINGAGGTTLAYNRVLSKEIPEHGVTVDTLVLTTVAGITEPARTTRADVPNSVEYIAMVRMIGTNVADQVWIEPHVFASDKRSLKVAAVSDGALVKCTRDPEDGRLWLRKVLNREPRYDGKYFASGSAGADVVDLSTPEAVAAWTDLVLTITGDLTDIDGGTP